MKVEWSDCARDDLDDLVRYISRDSGFYARRFAKGLFLPLDDCRPFLKAAA